MSGFRSARVAEGSEDQALVALSAHEFPLRTRPLLVRGKRFFVQGPTLRWPWVEYQDREAAHLAATPEVVEAYNHFTRILSWFRASGYGEIARVDELIENVASGGTETAQRLLGFCVDRNLIQRSGRLYEVNHEELGRFGIHWDDVRRRVLRAPVITLLTEFVRGSGR